VRRLTTGEMNSDGGTPDEQVVILVVVKGIAR